MLLHRNATTATFRNKIHTFWICGCVNVSVYVGEHKHPNETDNILLLHVLIRIGVLLWLFLSVTIWRAFCSFQSNIVVVMWLGGGFSILPLHFTSFIFITCIAFAHKNGTSTDAHKMEYSKGIISRWHSFFAFASTVDIAHLYSRIILRFVLVCVLVCVLVVLIFFVAIANETRKTSQCLFNVIIVDILLSFDKMCSIMVFVFSVVVIKSLYWIIKLTKSSIFKSF